MNDWKIFYCNHQPHNLIDSLPPAPSWRRFKRQQHIDEAQLKQKWAQIEGLVKEDSHDYQRGKSFRVLIDGKGVIQQAYRELIEGVNAAIYLRRPLLITGKPGSGKTSLAYAITGSIEPEAVTFPLCQQLVDEYICVEDEPILKAVDDINRHHQMIVELSSAITLACLEAVCDRACTALRDRLQGKTIVLVLSGGNTE